MEIHFGAKAQERRADSDRRTVHEHEFARDREIGPLRAQRLHHGGDLAPAVFAGFDAVGDGANAIVERWPANESRPDVHRLNRLAREVLEPPKLIGVDDARGIVGLEREVKLDDAADEARRENPDAAVVEEIDRLDTARLARTRRDDGIVAEMRVAMDDAVTQEGAPPRLEQQRRNMGAALGRSRLELQQLRAIEPFQREQALCRKFGEDARHAHLGAVGEHVGVEPRDLGFAFVIQFLAQPRRDLARNLSGVDRGAHAAAERKQHVQLRQVRFDCGGHFGILQLAGDGVAPQRHRAVNLAERGRRGGREVEFGEFLAPMRAQFRLHAPPHESRAHRRRVRLQAHQFLSIFGGQSLGNGREQLRDLHHRPLHRPKRLGERARVVARPGPRQAACAHLCGEGACIDAEPRIAPGARRKSIGFIVACHTGASPQACRCETGT